MINKEFIIELSAKLHSNHNAFGELYNCLIKFRDAGMEKDCMYASLEEMRRYSESEEIEDVILELMDFVVGFCNPKSAIYSES